MKKYLGIVKKETEFAGGIDIRILTKFSNNKFEIKRWIKLYPKFENLILRNNEKLENFFIDFEDITLITRAEKHRAMKLYEELMKE